MKTKDDESLTKNLGPKLKKLKIQAEKYPNLKAYLFFLPLISPESWCVLQMEFNQELLQLST